MSGFVFHPDALADLNEIWEFIAADNPALLTVSSRKSKKRYAHSSPSLKWATGDPI